MKGYYERSGVRCPYYLTDDVSNKYLIRCRLTDDLSLHVVSKSRKGAEIYMDTFCKGKCELCSVYRAIKKAEA